jgi:hypothetical protein
MKEVPIMGECMDDAFDDAYGCGVEGARRKEQFLVEW